MPNPHPRTAECARRYNLPIGDFPEINRFRHDLTQIKDISKFQKLDKSLVHEMDRVLATDIAKLLERCSVSSSSSINAVPAAAPQVRGQ